MTKNYLAQMSTALSLETLLLVYTLDMALCAILKFDKRF